MEVDNSAGDMDLFHEAGNLESKYVHLLSCATLKGLRYNQSFELLAGLVPYVRPQSEGC